MDFVKKNEKFIFLIVLLVLSYFVIFHKIDSFPFRLWDESMFAVNAYEMNENKNYTIPYFKDEVDWRNLKPLLITWIQVGFIKVFGFNELAIRLPSALAVFGSVIALFLFLYKRFDKYFAFISSMILLTSFGFISFHTGRTGDADALLSFFLLLSILNFFKFVNNENKASIFFSLLFFSLAILTKSVAALIFILPMFLIVVLFLRKRIKETLLSKFFWFGIVSIIAVIFFGFVYRDFHQPGYFNRMLKSDFGRFNEVVELHKEPWDFYLENIFHNRFLFWTIPFFTGILFLPLIKDESKKNILKSTVVIIGVYLLVISLSTTKLLWYDMPIYPFLAILAAYPIYFIFEKIRDKKINKYYPFLFLILVFLMPYRFMFFQAQSLKISEGDKKEEAISFFLKNKIDQNDLFPITVYNYGYEGSVLCYQYRYRELGTKLEIKRQADFSENEMVLIQNDSLIALTKELYEIEEVEINKYSVLYKIK